jgi:hypothetical protein
MVRSCRGLQSRGGGGQVERRVASHREMRHDGKMVPTYKLADVYGTSRSVPLTYVQRPQVDERFLNDITRDKHIVVHGSSKQGKTCLRKNQLKDTEYVVVQCTRDTTRASLYEMILKHAGISSSVTQEKTVKGTLKVHVKIGAEGGIPMLAKGKGEGGAEGGGEQGRTTKQTEFEIDIEDPNDVCRVLAAADFKRYIVIEDFHYLDEEVQVSLATDMKVFHEISSLVFIIVGVWLEANKLILYNGDLAGRVTTIDVDAWKPEELREVVVSGYDYLNINFPEAVETAIVESAQGNVGLLQELCYRLCERYDIWHRQDEHKEIATAEDVAEISRSIADEQSARYQNFLARFAEGLGETELKMYQWVAWAVVTAKPEELRRGLRPNVIFQRVREKHPNSVTLQQGNVTQALERVGKVQFKHRLQPLIFDYSNNELRVVDANFLVFLKTHSQSELLSYIGLAG